MINVIYRWYLKATFYPYLWPPCQLWAREHGHLTGEILMKNPFEGATVLQCEFCQNVDIHHVAPNLAICFNRKEIRNNVFLLICKIVKLCNEQEEY